MYMKAILRGCLFCIVSRGLVRSLYRKLDAVPKPKGWGTPQSGLGLFLFLIGFICITTLYCTSFCQCSFMCRPRQ